MDEQTTNVIEELIFNENIVYSKLNKKALDVLCRGGALDGLYTIANVTSNTYTVNVLEL